MPLCGQGVQIYGKLCKGDGNQFHDWMRRYHPGELMMPVIRTLGGDRQDSSFEGALPVYGKEILRSISSRGIMFQHKREHPSE